MVNQGDQPDATTRIAEIKQRQASGMPWSVPHSPLQDAADIRFLLAALSHAQEQQEQLRANQYPPDGTCLQCGTANAKGGIVGDEPHEGRVRCCDACAEKIADFYGRRRAVERAEQAESQLAALTRERAEAVEMMDGLRERRDALNQENAALKASRDEYRALAKVGPWCNDCRPNRHKAAQELLKSQAVIDKLADTISSQGAQLAALRDALRKKVEEWKIASQHDTAKSEGAHGFVSGGTACRLYGQSLARGWCAQQIDALLSGEGEEIGTKKEHDDPSAEPLA